MPKCLDCDNDKDFILTYIEFEVVTYEGDKIINQEAGDRERANWWINDKYLPECNKCNSTNIEGSF
jgi:hypothetical protein